MHGLVSDIDFDFACVLEFPRLFQLGLQRFFIELVTLCILKIVKIYIAVLLYER